MSRSSRTRAWSVPSAAALTLLLALLPVSRAAATGPSPGSGSGVQQPNVPLVAAPAVAAAGTPGAPADAADFDLQAGSDLSGRVTDLDDALPKQGVQNLLAQANRTLTTGSACTVDPFGEGDGGVAPLAPVTKYCWQSGDESSTEWIPQAITGVSDAQADEMWGTSRPVLTAWYDNDNPGRTDGCTASESDACNEKGVRVTFIDPASHKYRHVLLVWPYYNSYGHISYDAVHASEDPLQNGIHAGGIAWYGNYLYVADTLNGIRVFDMRDIMDLDPDENPATNDKTSDGLVSDVSDTRQVGRQDNVWYSYGYRYVMPQVASWSFTAAQSNSSTADTCAATGAPKDSYLSIDRSGDDALVMGEYCNSDTTHPELGRLAAFPLDSDTGALASTGGIAHAQSAYYLPHDLNQGVVRYNGAYVFNQSHSYSNGDILRAKVGSDGRLTDDGAQIRTAVGPEDLYLEHGQATGNPPLLWSLSEHSSTTADPSCARTDPSPCGRVVYAQALNTILASP